jgi:hypothetical protein
MTGFRLIPATGEPASYAENPESIVIPKFYALELTGEPGHDDFTIPRGPPSRDRSSNWSNPSRPTV